MITEAAAGPHPAVSRLVYLTGAIPDAGESLASLMPVTEQADASAGTETEAVRLRSDGMIELDSDSGRAALFHNCAPAHAEDAIAQLAPSNPAVGNQAVRAAAWHDIAVTYVRGSLDRMPELVTSHLPRAAIEQIEPNGHCPNWSQPQHVTQLLAARTS